MRLSICRAPYEDESLYGYAHDLFCMNMRITMGDIDEMFGCKLNPVSPGYLSMLKLHIDNNLFPDLPELIKMTAAGSLVHKLPEGRAARIMESVIQPPNACAVPDKTKKYDKIYICSDCWTEDTERYGRGYLHISHNLPGVKCCYKHGTALMEADMPKKRSLITAFDISNFKPLQGIDLKSELPKAAYAVGANGMELDKLVVTKCSVCGRSYPELPFSRETFAGCPYCNINMKTEDIIRRRLVVRYHGEYSLAGMNSFLRGKVRHEPCGCVTNRLDDLLYREDVSCRDCKKLTPKRLQNEFDPYGTVWKFYPVPEKDKKKARICVKHLVCGHKGYIFMQEFKNKKGGYCPVCDNPQEWIDIESIDPEYEIVGNYKNNREQIQIRHKTCGFITLMSKTSFLSGGRCALRAVRLSFDDVKEAVSECAPSWTLQKNESHRGYANLTNASGYVMPPMSYKQIIQELKTDRPRVITDRIKRYEDKKSVRRYVYDEVKRFTTLKGDWRPAKDGFYGREITRMERNILQDLANLGYVERISKGVYKAVIPDEEG